MNSLAIQEVQGTIVVVEEELSLHINEEVVTLCFDVGSSIDKYYESSSDPVSAPSAKGIFYLNTTTGQLWFATGTSSVSDWHEVLLGGSP